MSADCVGRVRLAMKKGKRACPAAKYFTAGVSETGQKLQICMFCGVPWSNISGTKQTAHLLGTPLQGIQRCRELVKPIPDDVRRELIGTTKASSQCTASSPSPEDGQKASGGFDTPAAPGSKRKLEEFWAVI